MPIDILPQLSPTPAPGAFYSVAYGDTLLGVAGTAFSVGPGGERLDRARLINSSAYNARFLGAATKLFPEGQLSFLPKFVDDPNAQAAGSSCPPGHGFATIWIPGENGDEPELNEPDPDPVEPDPIDPVPEKPKPIPTPFVDWEDVVRDSFTFPTGKHHRMVIRREIIPIILVPGIAGSALIPSDPMRSPRFPGWPVNDLKKMLRLMVKGPRLKRKNLIGDAFHDPGFLRVVGNNNPDAPEHGLAGVARVVYEKFVKAIGRAKFGSRNGLFFRLPVHCYGYNWTCDMRQSATGLAEFTGNLIAKYNRDNRRCRHVILVAHSAGGLVARQACLDASFAARVQAVVHVGVPHAGAPEVYHRIKKGFPRGTLLDLLFSAVTARDGDEGTILFANMPGALQLLPSKDYRTNIGESRWVVIEPTDGSPIRLPASNPYAEIYRSRNHSWAAIDPEILVRHLPRTPDNRAKTWASYVENLDRAEEIHDGLHGKDHPAAHYIAGHSVLTAETAEFRFIGDKWMIAAFKASPLSGFGRRQNKGKYMMVGKIDEHDSREWLVEMRDGAGNGDLTVSWKTAAGEMIGSGAGTGGLFEFPGLDHAGMLEDAKVEAAVRQIVMRSLNDKVAAVAADVPNSVAVPTS